VGAKKRDVMTLKQLAALFLMNDLGDAPAGKAIYDSIIRVRRISTLVKSRLCAVALHGLFLRTVAALASILAFGKPFSF